MLIKLMCFVFGHIFVYRNYTGKIEVKCDHIIKEYIWELAEFCHRCGKPNPYYKKEKERKII